MAESPDARHPVLVCTAWPYVNGSLHVGHLAGVYVPADVFARFMRMQGHDVLMVSGSDAHGTPITLRAEQEGTTPREVATRFHEEFLGYWQQLGISYDLYTSTMTPNHFEVSQDEFLILLRNGALFKEKSEGFYDPVARRFLPDTYIEGECPNCHYPRARGNQCENCGKLLEPEDLIKPYSRLNPDATLERRQTEHYYMDLGKYQQQMLDWVRQQDQWRPNVRRFTENFVAGGLQARAVTRDLDWGIPLPEELRKEPGWEDKKIYVWIEAVTGYLSASIEWAKNRGTPDAWHHWWKDPACRQYYFIGKDNIPFHTVIWPVILMARGDTILPYDVPANEYMNFGGQKASKSAGVGTTVPQLLAAFDPDTIRYYLIANAPENADTNFSEEDLISRNNNEILAKWGNLANRTLSFLQSRMDGVVPEHTTDPEVAEAMPPARERVADLLSEVHLRDAQREALQLAEFGNEWLNRQAPWNQIKTDRAAAEHTIGSALDLINTLKVLFAPFLPHTSQKLHEMLGYDGSVHAAGWVFEPLPAGRKLPAPAPLFRKLEPPAASKEAA